jgi:hypothetical protein
MTAAQVPRRHFLTSSWQRGFGDLRAGATSIEAKDSVYRYWERTSSRLRPPINS